MIENNEIYNEVMESINHYRQARRRLTNSMAFPDEEYQERVKKYNINLDFAEGNESATKLGMIKITEIYSEIEAKLWLLLVKIAECKKI